MKRRPRMPRHEVVQPLNQLYRYIPLTQGQTAKVSVHRYEKLRKFYWNAWWDEHTKGFYALRTYKDSKGRQQTIRMHRHILGLKLHDPRKGDHINRDTLDNTDENLRICDNSESCINRGMMPGNTSGHKGVHFRKDNGLWRARISLNKRRINLGQFDSKEKAAKAYRKAAKLYHGEFAAFD